MVGGLVQEEQVRLLQQQPGEGHAHAPAPGELSHGPSEIGVLETHSAQNRLRSGLQLVPLGTFERRLKPAHLVEHLLGTVGRMSVACVGIPARHRDQLAQLLEPVLHVQDLGVGGQHLVYHHMIRYLLDLLRQEPYAQVLAATDLPRVKRDLAGDDPQECGLSSTVGPHEAQAHSRLDVKAGVIQEYLAAEGFGDISDVKHARERIAVPADGRPVSVVPEDAFR